MKRRTRLFTKYFVPVAILLVVTLGVSSGVGAWFSYKQTKTQLITLQREAASAAAARIESYIRDVEHQIEWAALTLPSVGQSPVETRRIDFLKLLRQVPAITDLYWIDKDGRERLAVSRLTMDAAEGAVDRSADPRFIGAKAGKTYFGPVYFRKETEPYMSMAKASGSDGGVTIAEVNLKFVWDVVSQIRIGESGFAYAVNSDNLLIAHPDISLVLRKSDLSRLPQVATRAASSPAADDPSEVATDLSGEAVLTTHALIPMLNWRVFVELPVREAMAPIYGALYRAAAMILAALVLSILASAYLVRRLTTPIRALQDGAAQIGAGDLGKRIDIKTGDELEALADQFNAMAEQLAQSYEGLERKVAERTAQLASEQEKSRALLLNILPDHVIQELTTTGAVKPARHEEATVLFTDFAGFTTITSTMPASRMVTELNTIFAAFDEIASEVGIEKIKTIGDAYMACAGLLGDTPDHAHRCVRAALRMVEFIETRNRTAAFKWQLRVGVHSGPIVSGVVGKRKYAFDIWGDAVNIASRMESAGEAGKVNLSAYTYDLIQDQFTCSYRGKVSAKGKGDIDMYFVEAERATA